MLNRLLELLRDGGTHRVTDLALTLDTTPELVEAMLEELDRLGYVKQVGGECAEKCSACPLAGLCAAGTPSDSCGPRSPKAGGGRVWTLTQKGQPSPG